MACAHRFLESVSTFPSGPINAMFIHRSCLPPLLFMSAVTSMKLHSYQHPISEALILRCHKLVHTARKSRPPLTRHMHFLSCSFVSVLSSHICDKNTILLIVCKAFKPLAHQMHLLQQMETYQFSRACWLTTLIQTFGSGCSRNRYSRPA